MIINANGHQINAFSAYEDSVIRGPKTYPSLVIRLLEMPTAEQLSALASGSLNIGGTSKTGYTHLADLSLTLYQMSDEAQQVEQLTEQVQTKTAKLLNIATALPDELAVQHPDLYDPMLYTGEPITAGTRINWRGSIAKANVTLWDREDNDPEHAPDLWTVLQVQGGYRVIPNPIPATETFAPGEIGLWEDGKLYKSIHPSPHAWTPAEYPEAWEVYEP